MPVFVSTKLFVCSSHSITGDGNRGQDWPQCLNALMRIVKSHWGIVSYLTKMIMLPLSPVTCHHLYLNSEPRRKAWAETVDRIWHGHQVTSSEYWTDTGDNQTSEQGQKNTGYITQTSGHGTILLTRGHWDGVRCQDDFGKTLNIEYLVLSALSACLRRLPFAGAVILYTLYPGFFKEMYFTKITSRRVYSIIVMGLLRSLSLKGNL